jgi:tetratricopeptide (TPR) repeat protein
MKRDGFDRLVWLGLAASLGTLAMLFLLGSSGGDGARSRAAVDKAMEREMAYQARVAFLQKLYGPVEVLREKGERQRALLKLEELGRRYPGEAHGYMLKGAVLAELGALEEAIASYVRGVRLNGDYIDERSPLSRRTEIRQVVERGLEVVGEKARSHPDNPSPAAALKDVYYLQSRLAGGCE